jgi:photosystem II stability/assembly factor-like uncharacterized protein
MVALFAFALTGAACALPGSASDDFPVGQWQSLSRRVAASIPDLEITEEGGFSVTGSLVALPGSGDLFIVGIGTGRFVRSRDLGETWEKVDAHVAGRTYGGYSVNVDPQTGGMVVFEIKKKNVPIPAMAMTTDGGESWHEFVKPTLKAHDGFSWGSANWADEAPKVILAKRHHGAPEQWLSTDRGKVWHRLEFLCRNPGVIDETTFVAGIDDSVTSREGVEGVENGIYLSNDQGISYEKVSDFVPTGKWPKRWGRNFYWVVDDGLIVTRDSGRTWQHTGGEVPGALWGPYFGRNEHEMMVVGREGYFVTHDGGASWRKVHEFYVPGEDNGPEKNYNVMHPNASFGWNPEHDLLYSARIWWTAERLRLPEGTLSKN